MSDTTFITNLHLKMFRLKSAYNLKKCFLLNKNAVWIWVKCTVTFSRMFAQTFSTQWVFLKLLLWTDNDLLVSEMK